MQKGSTEVRAKGRTIKSPDFDVTELLDNWRSEDSSLAQDDDLQAAIEKTFKLKINDGYVYHASASVTLPQVQAAINCGGQNGLHAWYLHEGGAQIPPPPGSDAQAYTSIFSSSTSTSKALVAFEKNAKKGSIRAATAKHLISNRLVPEKITITKLKKAHVNPYLDFWTWSCKSLEWAGPNDAIANVNQSHHILPVFYHHFGCVCPSFDAIESMRQLAQGKPVLDIGSGNGYWTMMLRRSGLKVNAIDNGDSIWRTMWIDDTVKADGAQFLTKNNGGKDAALLLVYPQVSTDFTRSVLKAYQGDLICVAGTQNSNGFTSFKNETIDQYLIREEPDFEKILQTPLPSFAGKDDALYAYRKRP
ncbi:MAG: hypothetical protein M1828_002021 [Chrysothrix sp. TS-e1954]|nr:MAG: hypothetical protein M1828_002021 [Chrysothrix sp. TS-e1954]